MQRKRGSGRPDEDKKLRAFMDDVFPRREPVIRIYRIEPTPQENTHFRKQTRLGEIALSEDVLEMVRCRFGAGTYLLRSVRSDGTYGPSRAVKIG